MKPGLLLFHTDVLLVLPARVAAPPHLCLSSLSVWAAISWRRESVRLEVHQSDTSGQPRWLDPQWECQSSLPGNFVTTFHCLLFVFYLLITIEKLQKKFMLHQLHLFLSLFLQGFTYVAPSVLENIKEKFSFEPKIRSPRRIVGSPRTPLRYVSVSAADTWTGLHPWPVNPTFPQQAFSIQI